MSFNLSVKVWSRIDGLLVKDLEGHPFSQVQYQLDTQKINLKNFIDDLIWQKKLLINFGSYLRCLLVSYSQAIKQIFFQVF